MGFFNSISGVCLNNVVHSAVGRSPIESNDTIIKYENIEKHQDFKWKPFREKTTGRGESFTINMRIITKYNRIENKL